jgi:hypothetical protein
LYNKRPTFIVIEQKNIISQSERNNIKLNVLLPLTFGFISIFFKHYD